MWSVLRGLNALEGDPDLEAGFDQETVREGEGDYDEREPDAGGLWNWQGEGDQTPLRMLAM